MSSEAAILEEISRLSGAINRHKTGGSQPPPPHQPPRFTQRGPPHKPMHFPAPRHAGLTEYTPRPRPGPPSQSTQSKEVVIDGITFQSNGKTLVRKTVTPPTAGPSSAGTSTVATATTSTTVPTPSASSSRSPTTSALPSSKADKPLIRTRNGLIAADRYKQHPAAIGAKPPIASSKAHSRYRPVVTGYSARARPGRNLTLTKKFVALGIFSQILSHRTLRPKSKKIDKQCKHFTRTGASAQIRHLHNLNQTNCNATGLPWFRYPHPPSWHICGALTTGMCGRGLTCKYQHDPAKIALCPLFILEKCPNTADSCVLSHDPTPERTPLCTRFNNTGECYKGSKCLFPHIRVGPKKGICRDFAVLGYCDKGALCDSSHLKECPDFAETGNCPRMGLKGAAGCHLPHVIRANQRRVKAQEPSAASVPVEAKASDPGLAALGAWSDSAGEASNTATGTNTNAEASKPVEQDPEEFISLTFEESDEEEEDDDDDGDNDSDDNDEDDNEADEGGEPAEASPEHDM